MNKYIGFDIAGIIERIPVRANGSLLQARIASQRMGAFGRIEFDVPPAGEHE